VVDWFVVLSPLLVVAVILLLGFTGCDLIFTVNPPPGLTLRILVPSQLTVVDSRFVFTQPGTTTQETLTGLDRSDDGSGTVVLSHVVDSPAKGSWTVNAGLIVSDGTRQDSATVDGPFTLDDDAPGGTATFEASGSPATNDFTLTFDGFVP
jgi:hypothetical protein